MVDLEARHLALLKKILSEYIPGRTVWLFGSRATGKTHRASDIDLAVMGEERLDRKIYSDLAYALEESDLPYRVDLVDWAVTKENFRKIIEKDHEVIQ